MINIRLVCMRICNLLALKLGHFHVMAFYAPLYIFSVLVLGLVKAIIFLSFQMHSELGICIIAL